MSQATTGIHNELKKKLLTQALKEPLFHDALDDAADEIVSGSTSAPNEATVEAIFENVLYSVLRDIGLRFRPVKEKPIATRRHIARGRTDSRLGALVIEFKQPSTLSSSTDIASARKQLLEYLDAICNELDTVAVGWITDGTKTCELRIYPDGTSSDSGFSALNGISLRRLTQHVISLEQSALNSTNLINDFCGINYDGIIFRLARTLSKILGYESTLKSEMLRSEWVELFRLAHEDQSQQRRIVERRAVLSEIFDYKITEASLEYQSLFCLHTAYAIILKFIAYRVVCDVKFNTVLQDFKSVATSESDILRIFCAALEDGEIFRQIGILNLLEGDFFSWYADKRQWNDNIADEIRGVAQTLSRYEDVKSVFSENNAVDLFRSLYEATVPQTVRASFGEFYTPFWLAQHVVESANFPAVSSSALDPCCGSGTFLIAAIGALRSEKRSTPWSASEIMNRVAGIDLNPLAVLTARIHYFIHIADLIEEEDLNEFVIPVFLGDASNVPTIITENGIPFIHYELKTLKTPLTINIPQRMCDDFVEFSRTMFAFESLVHNGDYNEARLLLVDAAVKSEKSALVAEKVGALADQLIELERKEWNGIWARIITNFVATSQIGPFDTIIGNPPWIDWKSLPSGYREKIKNLCIDKGLFSGAGRTGGINLNVCALITHVAATNWLSHNGRLAFLMPKELINQASYEGWRTAVGGTNVNIVEIHDWSKSGHPFDPVKEDFLTYVLQRTGSTQSILPVFLHEKTSRKNLASQWTSIDEAMANLNTKKMSAGQIIEGQTIYTIAENSNDLEKFKHIAGECSYIGREGIEFYPQELMVFRFESVGPKAGTAWLRNIQVSRSKYKIPEQRILLETKFLFPLSKGPGIGRMHYNDPDLYVAFPYEKSNPHAPISQNLLAKSSPLLLSFYKKFQKQLEQQTAYSDSIRGDGEFYGVARTGPYSFEEFYVAYRDNTKWRATVMSKKLCPWGEEKRFLFQNHAVSICERSDGYKITEDEAFFVAGILNCPIVEKFIYASSDNRSFKIRPPIYVPLFDPKDNRHLEISKISKSAHNKSEDFVVEMMAEVEAIYIGIAKERI